MRKKNKYLSAVESNTENIDIWGSVGFGLEEGIRDLIWRIKILQKEVDELKEEIKRRR